MSEPCNSFWYGPQPGPVERACFRSVIAQGHPLTLWCYEEIKDPLPGMVMRDAAAILPRDQMIFHRAGSVALFANRFRYELQRREFGIWVDSDIYLVRPLDNLGDTIFGWAAPDHINTAVLKLPKDSPLLKPLLELFDEAAVPAWLAPRARVPAWWRLKTTGRSDLSKMPWGSAGPLAMTWLARKHQLDVYALPKEYFYPRHWDEACWILDPRIGLEDVVGTETRAVHLWNELIKGFKNLPAPSGSFLERLQREGAA